MTEFGRGIDVAVHTVEQIEKSFEVIIGVPCRTRTEGLEQALTFGRCEPVSICHLVPLHVLKTTQQPENRATPCASASVDLYPSNTVSLLATNVFASGCGRRLPAYCLVMKSFIHNGGGKTLATYA
ncbi:MAG TPA: hypothetical protein VJ761_03295 [Ktedonobacteraceae bacterium]|nr:hypothetical protein [Ktedonobacteraceae bacterium]